MGWLGLKSLTLRCVLHRHLFSPAPNFYRRVSCALFSLNDPIVRSFSALGQTCSQDSLSQEFDRLGAGNLLLGREFDAFPMGKRAVTCERVATEFGSTGASFSRGLSGVRVRVLDQVVRGFSSTIVQGVEAKCWSCEERSTATPFFICSSCKAIQPLDQDVDFFQLLSVERSYVQDPKMLERQYKQLQKFLHPDLSSRKSEREQVYAADQSAQVIKAYYTLLDPLSRAQYMLRLDGVNVDEEGTIHDPVLLLEIMELREEVEEATDPAKLVKLKEQNKKKMLGCEHALKEVFRSGDIMQAVPLVQRMTYYHKIIEEIIRKQ